METIDEGADERMKMCSSRRQRPYLTYQFNGIIELFSVYKRYTDFLIGMLNTNDSII